MRKPKAVIVLMSLLLASCLPSDDEGVIEAFPLARGKVGITTIRGCEYVWYETAGGYGAGICHAGDCPNPIHGSVSFIEQPGDTIK